MSDNERLIALEIDDRMMKKALRQIVFEGNHDQSKMWHIARYALDVVDHAQFKRVSDD